MAVRRFRVCAETSFSAVVAEVRVDLGLVRLKRFVGAYDVGRILNPTEARAQPGDRRHHLGRRTGPAGAFGDRSDAGGFMNRN
jgi:hypothetical protein